MQDVNIVSGRIIEIRRYVTPLWLYGQDAPRERWELWIKTPNGADEKLIVESRSMQARRGHRVVLALEAGAPVGMVNLTTRTRLNFARSDPPFTVPIAVLCVPLLMTARWLSRRSVQRRVEDMPDQIDRDASLPAERQRS